MSKPTLEQQLNVLRYYSERISNVREKACFEATIHQLLTQADLAEISYARGYNEAKRDVVNGLRELLGIEEL